VSVVTADSAIRLHIGAAELEPHTGNNPKLTALRGLP
jgi:hypothetical protein